MTTPISEKSNHLYMSSIATMKAAGIDPLNVEATMKWIRESKIGKKGKVRATTTQKNFVTSVIHWLKSYSGVEAVRDEYRKILVEYAVKITETYKDQKLTDTEKEKFLEWPEIVKVAEKIRKDVRLLDSDKLLVDFYTAMPPVRLDYCHLRVYSSPPPKDEGNYAVIVKRGRCYVRLNEHKTAKKNGTLENEIPPALATRIRLYLKANPTETTLFKMDEKQMNRRLTLLFRNACGKNISVNILRHSYISHFMDGAPSLRKCEALAKTMGHSVLLQQYYRRLKGEEAEKESVSSSDSESSVEEAKPENGVLLIFN